MAACFQAVQNVLRGERASVAQRSFHPGHIGDDARGAANRFEAGQDARCLSKW